MSSKTTNFNLHKIDLTDAPPDITVINQNWDIIDEELLNAANSANVTPADIGAVAIDGSNEMTGQLKTPKVVFDRSNGAYGDCGIYKNNANGDAPMQIMDKGSNNKFGILSISGQTQTLKLTLGEQDANGNNTSSTVYDIYHGGNPPTAEEVGALPASGGTMSGTIELKKVENGYGRLAKNHSSSVDYGTYLTDVDKNGNTVKIIASGQDNAAYFVPNDNSGSYKIYSAHNITRGTTELTAGTSELATGAIYLMYE